MHKKLLGDKFGPEFEAGLEQLFVARLSSSLRAGSLQSALSDEPSFVFVVHPFYNQILGAKDPRPLQVNIHVPIGLDDGSGYYLLGVPVLLPMTSTTPYNGEDQDDQHCRSGAGDPANDAGSERA